MRLSGAFIVSYSFSGPEEGVLIVGKQENGTVNVVNAFQGKEAMDIFRLLSTQKKKEKEESKK